MDLSRAPSLGHRGSQVSAKRACGSPNTVPTAGDAAATCEPLLSADGPTAHGGGGGEGGGCLSLPEINV